MKPQLYSTRRVRSPPGGGGLLPAPARPPAEHCRPALPAPVFQQAVPALHGTMGTPSLYRQCAALRFRVCKFTSGASPLLANNWPNSSTTCNIKVVSRHSDKGGKDT